MCFHPILGFRKNKNNSPWHTNIMGVVITQSGGSGGIPRILSDSSICTQKNSWKIAANGKFFLTVGIALHKCKSNTGDRRWEIIIFFLDVLLHKPFFLNSTLEVKQLRLKLYLNPSIAHGGEEREPYICKRGARGKKRTSARTFQRPLPHNCSDHVV